MSKGWFKFFLSGKGMSFRTGRYFLEAALLGGITGMVTSAFQWMIVQMDWLVGRCRRPGYASSFRRSVRPAAFFSFHGSDA